MATASISIPKMNLIISHVEPWQRKDYTSRQESHMVCDWATVLKRIGNYDAALHYYDKALEFEDIKPNSHALYLRSNCRRQLGLTKEALSDIERACELAPNKPNHQLALAEVLNEMTDFEGSLLQCFNEKRKFKGSCLKGFEDQISLTHAQLDDSLGNALNNFFLKNTQLVNNVFKEMNQKNSIDKSNVWKISHYKDDCCLSKTRKQKLMSPLENARRVQSLKIFFKTYFQTSWKDIMFLYDLRNMENSLGQHFIESTPILKHIAESKYNSIKKIARILHARDPMYSVDFRVNQKLKRIQKEKFLYALQNKTRRNMFAFLRQIRLLRSKLQIEKFANYIESFMGDYVVLKTNRIMPWKFEFINDVYNTLALAFAESYIRQLEKSQVNSSYSLDALFLLLKMDNSNYHMLIDTDYRSQSVVKDRKLINNLNKKYDDLIVRLEKRIRFSEYSIERAYLWHAIARVNLKQNRFYECRYNATKSIDESKKCNNNLWTFLSHILIAKSHAALRRKRQCKKSLEDAEILTTNLQSKPLYLFVKLAIEIVEELITSTEQKLRSSEMFRKQNSQSLERSSTVSKLSVE